MFGKLRRAFGGATESVLRLAVRVEREQAEIVLAELLELAPGGVEEVSIGPGVVEYAVYGAPGELPALPDLTAAAGEALVEVRTRQRSRTTGTSGGASSTSRSCSTAGWRSGRRGSRRWGRRSSW